MEWRYAYPKVKLSTFRDFMSYVEEHYGSELETVKGDGGPYWEDGYATDAHYLAIDRSSQQRAPSAEKLSTIATYFEKNVSGPAEQIRTMWNDLVLYAEHTFTSWGGYSRPESEETLRQFEVKDHFAVDGRLRVNGILDQSLSQLADKIHVPATALVVFNPLNWTRSELVETDLDAGNSILEYPDKTPVSLEVLARHAGYNRVRFLARDVPSLGYRCYQVTPRNPQADPSAAEETSLPRPTRLRTPTTGSRWTPPRAPSRASWTSNSTANSWTPPAPTASTNISMFRAATARRNWSSCASRCPSPSLP